MAVIDTVAPVFILIGIGALLFRSFLDAAVLRGVNWLTYWVGLPVLLFNSIAAADLVNPAAIRVFLVVLGATIITVVTAAIAVRLTGLRRTSGGTFLQATFRGNLAFIGIPVVIFAYPESSTAGTLAVLTLAPMMLVYNVISVLVLQRSQTDSRGWEMMRTLLRALFANPLIVGSALGAIVAVAGVELPFFLQRSMRVLGETAPGLALISIGGSLAVVKLGGRLKPAVWAAAFKVALCPLAGVLLAYLLGLEGEALGVALIFLAAPTAAASFILAQQFGGDEGLASGAIVISTLFSIVSLSLVVAFC